MSETADDDGGIDKEALREELREKYAEDDRKREATQRMSDLLLKGATMTNSHCDTCGDPLFRQNGTTFCPTCHGGPEGVEASTAEPGAREQAPDEAEQAANGAEPARQRSDDDPEREAEPAPEERTFDPESSPTNPDAARSVPERGRPGTGETPTLSGDESTDTPGRPAPTAPGGGDVDAAAESLSHALERFAREAATADDPRYARDCLEAAHEAADALAALRR